MAQGKKYSDATKRYDRDALHGVGEALGGPRAVDLVPVVVDPGVQRPQGERAVLAQDGAGEVAQGSAGDAAGVSFYAGAATQRATAKDATEAERAVEQAKEKGVLPPSARVEAETLAKIGYSADEARDKAEAYQQNDALRKRLDDENYLSGFGNNGGEEFISYMMSSESIVITGGETWDKWNKKMHTMFEKIQNADGSWSGHHCITSPVICTAAALLCLTADRDVHVLIETSPLVKADKKSEES